MDSRRMRAFRKRDISRLARILLVLMGLTISAQGCVELERSLMEIQREHSLKQQLKLAEGELKKGNLFSSRTLFESVYAESKNPFVQERALFFSGFTILLDKKGKDRWERSREIYLRGSEEFPEGEFGQICAYVATSLSDILSAMRALEKENTSMRQKIDLAMSQTREMGQLVQKQRKQLSEKTDQIAALKNSIRLRSEEIKRLELKTKSLELKIKKLEEIHKEIKKKRMGLS